MESTILSINNVNKSFGGVITSKATPHKYQNPHYAIGAK